MKTKKLIKWAITNAAVAALLYVGIQHQNGCASLAVCILWINFIFTLLLAIFTCGDTESHHKFKALVRKEGFSAPPWIGSLLDLAIASYLAWHGYVITGLICLIQNRCQAGIKFAAESDVTTPHSHASPPEHSPHNS